MRRVVGDSLVRASLGLVLLFLYLPMAIMMVMAFNRSQLYELPVQFDTVWFAALMQNERLLQASLNSVLIAIANTVLATILGTMAALAFHRYSFRGKTLLQLLLIPPITVPWPIAATPLLALVFCAGAGRRLAAMRLRHGRCA